MTKRIINIGVIAHVDHGKTTLLDNLLKQSEAVGGLDNDALERERGITMFSKCAGIAYKDLKVNFIDTPGHSDFGGEVERVMCMVDSVLLLVDSAEGVMPQTKFVLAKALSAELKPIVIINKIDKQDSRVEEVVDEIYDLFLNLDANDEQLEFPILYGSGRDGWCTNDLKSGKRDSLLPVLEAIVEYSPIENYDHSGDFKMLVSMLENDQFLGKILIGKIQQGSLSCSANIKAINLAGEFIESTRITRLQTFSGLNRSNAENVQAGDIVAVAGFEKASVTDTIADQDVTDPIQALPIDPTTISINISVNNSPLAGKEGNKLTSRVIKDRLMQEIKTNVSIKVEELDDSSFEVKGRGELQLGVLIENMRREGFELSVARPKVIFKHDEDGNRLEPMEDLTIDVDEEYSGSVMEELNNRRGIMKSMETHSNNRVRMVYVIPARSLIGYHGKFLSDTRGTGILNKVFHGYAPYSGKISSRKCGVLISTNQGEAVGYAIFNLQDRGIMFIKPQDVVYAGMVVGEHNRDNDLDINVLKGKQLTNVRASGTDEAIKLSSPRIMTLEQMVAYINDDELVEVTPKSLRIRKKILDINERKKIKRNAK